MTQMAMGMMGFFVVHPRNSNFMKVDRDFVFLLNAFDIEPGSATPKIATMLDFNLWCWNSRIFPGIDPFVVRKNDRVRIRFGNLTMTNHPIHMHGYDFEVTCTDGGWVPKSRAGRRCRSTWLWGRCAPSSSMRSIRATGRSTATSRITR